jgi:hypothetical protein
MASGHLRNFGPMLSSARCGARTRSGQPCQSPAAHDKKRCRMHGGAAGSGAPKHTRMRSRMACLRNRPPKSGNEFRPY